MIQTVSPEQLNKSIVYKGYSFCAVCNEYAEIIDDIGIVEIIAQELGIHEQEKVSAGQVVKAMLINCMGFLTAPLYLFSEFFAGKATEHLIGVGVKAEYLNDSRIGRVLVEKKKKNAG
ncbi:DUF4277 domain-containing protein [Nostoc punctiforme UO1]